MIDPSKLTTRVVSDLEEADFDPAKMLEVMSAEEMFNIWLEWNGIIGYTSAIIGAIDSIREAKVPSCVVINGQVLPPLPGKREDVLVWYDLVHMIQRGEASFDGARVRLTHS